MNYWDSGYVPKYVRSEASTSIELEVFATPLSREVARYLALCGPSTSNEIAEELAVANLAVHRTLLRLESLGIVSGSPDANNRNGRRVTWTINLDRADQVTRALADFIKGK